MGESFRINTYSNNMRRGNLGHIKLIKFMEKICIVLGILERKVELGMKDEGNTAAPALF